jgi:hypothetical protein
MISYEKSDMTLADAQPILGRAVGVPPETVTGFIIVAIVNGDEVGLACSDNISPDDASIILDKMAQALTADRIMRREGLN